MSEKLYIERGKSTPKIVFSPEDNSLLIEGESFPEDATVFYEPIIRKVKGILGTSDRGIELQIRLLYINTSSSKALLILMDALEEAHLAGKECRVSWFYDEDNEIACEIGEDLTDGLRLPFRIEKIT